jgi:hypothetical protein
MLTLSMTQLRLKNTIYIYNISLYFIMDVSFKESFMVLLKETTKRKKRKLTRKTNDARILFY